MGCLFEQVFAVLQTSDKYTATDGMLLRNSVYEDAMKMDKALIRLLLNNEVTVKRFFTDIDGVKVFDKQGFAWFVNNRQFLPDCYTRFKNKIGLVDETGEFISQSGKVELVFPYKDCILEGGQTKEDQKRDEIFYNETLTPDEVDRLLYPKVFTNAKRYTKDGVEEALTFRDDDNLIIKGNNLLAISSLLKRYEGKIKLIYIDPPYNTGNDSFGYNDSFHHSTWLTFICNRIKVASKLLREDGVIFIQCDDNEQSYLKLLCDDILGRENFVNCIAVKMSEATGVKMSHAEKRYPKLKEYILFYKKPYFSRFEEIDKYRIDNWDNENNIYLENFTQEDRNEIIRIDEKMIKSDKDVDRIISLLKPVKKVSLKKKMDELGVSEENAKEWLFNNSYRIIKTCGSSSLHNLVKSKDKKYDQDIACALSKQNVLFFYITDYNTNTAQPRLRVIFADENLYKNPCDFWQDIKTTGAISNEGGVQLLNGKKPEKILHRIIKMVTKPNDLVLDFFSGSGTTGAVAHKLNRHYILCEQIDDHVNKQVTRLNNVIMGDTTGISRDVGWQGGGTFVYCELAKLNQTIVEEIEKADNDSTLSDIYSRMKNSGFISYKVNSNDINPDSEDFALLSLDDKKRFLMKILDKNLLYVNYCDIDDEEFNISEADKAFTHSFYNEEV